MDQNYQYETKCRRCGELTEWYFARAGKVEWIEFAKAMTDYISLPRTHQCKKCNKNTVQDVVSFSPTGGE